MKTFSFNTVASAIPPIYEKKAKYGKYGAYIWDPTVGSALFIFNDYGDHEQEWTDLRLKDQGRTSLLPYENYALVFSWWAYRQKSRRDEFFFNRSMERYTQDLETGQMHPEDSPIWMSHYKFLVELREEESQADSVDWAEEESGVSTEYSDLKAEVAMALEDGDGVVSVRTAVALVAHIERLNDVIAQRAISDLELKRPRKEEQSRPPVHMGQFFSYDQEDGIDCLDIDELNSLLSEMDSARDCCDSNPVPLPDPDLKPVNTPKKRGRKPKANS